MDFSSIGYVFFCVVAALEWSLVSSSRCPALTLPNGRVRTRSRGRSVQFRCKRGFTRVGHKMAICLKSKQWSQNPPLCVGQGCPELELPAALNAKKFFNGGILHFTCAPGYTRQGPQQINCNGEEWNSEPPTCQKGISLGCDFEREGLCGWNQVLEEDNMDWTRHKGGSPTKDTGPGQDHTLGTPEGHYLFIEASAPSRKGHAAQLISPKYAPQDVLGICMEFFYHMFGSDKEGDVGSLEVFLKPSSVPLNQLMIDDKVMSLFEMDGNQGDEWHRQEIEIPPMTESFQFVFEATKQNSWLSDIALDDIRLYNCTNSTTTIITSPTERPNTIPPTTTTPAAPKTTTTTTTTTPQPVTYKRRTTTTTTTTQQPSTTRRRTTTTTLPPITTRRRTTTTTQQPTTRRRRTTTTTLPPTTRRQRTTTTTQQPSTIRRRTTTTTTQQPTTRRRRTTTTTQQPSTIRRRTTTTTTQQPSTRRRRTTTTTIYQNRWTRRRSTTTNTQKLQDISTPTSNKSPLTPPKYDPIYTEKVSSHKTPPPPPSPSIPAVKADDSTPNKKETMETSPQTITKIVKTTIHTNDGAETSNETMMPLLGIEDAGSTYYHDYNNSTTDGGVGVGESQERQNSSASGSMQLIPLIAGVAAAVLLVAIVVAVLAYKWSKKQRMKEEKDMDDQLNIITDYVETSLSR